MFNNFDVSIIKGISIRRMSKLMPKQSLFSFKGPATYIAYIPFPVALCSHGCSYTIFS